jgi:RNA polymerase sigma-70 factor (ECF subfamily)
VQRVDAGALAAGPVTSKLVRGARAVAEQAFMFRQYAQYAQLALVNGALGVFTAPEGRPLAVMSVTIADGRITSMYILADPERLARLDLPSAEN